MHVTLLRWKIHISLDYGNVSDNTSSVLCLKQSYGRRVCFQREQQHYSIFSLSFLSWTFPLAAGLFIQGEGLIQWTAKIQDSLDPYLPPPPPQQVRWARWQKSEEKKHIHRTGELSSLIDFQDEAKSMNTSQHFPL